MLKKINQKGFTLSELLVVIAIISILASISIPNLMKYYRAYKFLEYSSSLESLTRFAKMTALERSSYIGLCINGNSLEVRNLGTNSSITCSGTLINSLVISENYLDLSGSGAVFDPRGFANRNGTMCISNSTNYFKVTINRFGTITINKGIGSC